MQLHLPWLRPPLQAHQGDVRLPYFSHYRGSECGVGYETALHLLAKEVLQDTKRLLLPSLRAFPDESLWREGTKVHPVQVVEKWTRITFDSVSVEAALGQIIPDVVLELQGRKLLVEIKVTHGIDKEKLAKIQELDISTIEFDFSSTDRAVTKAELKHALIDQYMPGGFGRGYWVHHTKFAEAKEKATRQYLEEYPIVEALESPKVKQPAQKTLFD